MMIVLMARLLTRSAVGEKPALRKEGGLLRSPSRGRFPQIASPPGTNLGSTGFAECGGAEVPTVLLVIGILALAAVPAALALWLFN